jgi:hypothetical protein
MSKSSQLTNPSSNTGDRDRLAARKLDLTVLGRLANFEVHEIEGA